MTMLIATPKTTINRIPVNKSKLIDDICIVISVDPLLLVDGGVLGI